MKAAMKAVCCVVLTLFGASLAASAAEASQGDKTITKVVKLLQTMLEKSKTEGKEEKTIYGKFKCYCDTNDAEKTDSVASLEKTVNLLESAIDSLQSDNGELSSQTAKLKADMADNEAARKSATDTRDKAKTAFTAEEKDLKEAIGQMTEAIKVLAEIGADQTMGSSATDHNKFMADKKSGTTLVAIGAEVKNALAAASVFLNADQKKTVGSFLQGPSFTGAYSAQSGQIVGILKDMKATFKTNLEDSTATEKKDQEAHDAFMKIKKEAFDSMDKVFNEKQDNLASNDGALTSKKQQFQTATKDKADAEEFLEKLSVACAKKEKEYDERNLSRANEEAAISEAISILNSDSAFESFGTVSATSTGGTGGTSTGPADGVLSGSFLQLGSRRNLVNLQGQLEQVLRSSKTARLQRVLGSLEAGNPFTTVLLEIEKMKNLNEEEGKEDKKNLDFCKSERTENNKNLDDRDADILNLNGDIDKLSSTISDPVKGLKQQLKDTEASLVQNVEAQGSQTKQRTEENIAYQADIKNLVDAEALLGNAIKVLSEYYDGLAKKLAKDVAFAQKKEDPAPPDTWDSFKGQSSKGGDAVTMLKFILSETEKEQFQAHTDEEKGQADYEDAMQSLKEEQAKNEASIIKLQEDVATEEKNLLEKKDDLKDAETAKATIEDYLLKIKPGCDFIAANFDTREANRKTETTALTKAVTLIKATPAYQTAMAEAKTKSFGKCKAPCSADEAGAKCKACLAGVSVPGYCAGHPGVSGC